MKRRSSWTLVFQGDSLHHAICIADINIRSHDKGIKRFSPETVGAQGEMLGDGVDAESAQPTWGWCWTQSSRGEQTRNQPAWKIIPKETWCRCAAALNPGLPAKSCLKETERSPMGQTKHVSDWLDYSLWRKNTEKPWYFAILYRKTLVC